MLQQGLQNGWFCRETAYHIWTDKSGDAEVRGNPKIDEQTELMQFDLNV